MPFPMPFFARLCIVGLFAAALTACAAPGGSGPSTRPSTPATTPPSTPVVRQDLRIGLLLPLTGQGAVAGEALLHAAELALFDMNDARVTLIPADTTGSPAGAERAVRTLLDQNVQIILGPLFATSVSAVTPLVQQAGVPLIAFSSDRQVAARGVYVMGFTPEEQIAGVLDHALRAGLQRFAALLPDNDFGSRALQVMQQQLDLAQAELVRFDVFPNDVQRLADPVKRLGLYDRRRQDLLAERDWLRSLGEDDLAKEVLAMMAGWEVRGPVDFDAVLVAAGGPILRALAPQLPYYEIDPDKVRFLGTGQWDDVTLISEPALLGAWYAAPPPEAGQQFMGRYSSVFGQTPPRLASLAYDAMALVAVLLRNSSSNMPFTPAAIQQASGFVGVDGLFRFGADGVVQRALAINQIRRDRLVTIRPAPPRFYESGSWSTDPVNDPRRSGAPTEGSTAGGPLPSPPGSRSSAP